MRPIAFVLASTGYGPMILNRLDYAEDDLGRQYGAGHQLLTTGFFDLEEVSLAVNILKARHESHGDGVVAVDCGANVGAHCLSWASAMTGWGEVIAFEPQERIYYALAGNVALANLFNIRVHNIAVGASPGKMMMPMPNYLQPGSFGSLELKYDREVEYIGQAISYEHTSMQPVVVASIDALELPRLDLLKIDVERMEPDVLRGAIGTIEKFRPALIVEWIKSGKEPIFELLEPFGYGFEILGPSIVATPP